MLYRGVLNKIKMEKIVISWEYSDGYTYSGTETIPLEYKSKNELETLILDILKKEIDNRSSNIFSNSFKIRDYVFDFSDFIDNNNCLKDSEYFPKIQTLNEWFENNKI